MKAVTFLLLTVLGGFAVPPSFAQTWTPTSAPVENWLSVASSADGTRLVAAFQTGGIYTSTNSGATWQPNNVSNPTRAALSADGMKLALAAGNKVYVSTNGGGIWFSNVLGQDISGIASSADGTELVAVNPQGNGGHIFTSTNGGMTWMTNAFAGRNWTSVASSADGTKLIATANTGGAGAGIYTSTNSGLTWASNAVPVPAPDWACAASSADGTRLAAGIGGNGGAIFTSTNSGASWISNTIPRKVWVSLASSADGSKLVAASTSYQTIFTSADGGSTWVSNNVPKISWWSVASSADGNSLVAVANNNGIYISQTAPSPQMSLGNSNGALALAWIVPSTSFVLQSSADLSAWFDVTNEVALNLTNLQEEISLPVSASNAFFRLSTSP
jgi:hypothetical protein